MSPTVSGTVTDSSGNAASWSADFTVGSSSLLPGQVAGKTLAGLCTDNYTTRVNELARPIGADHFFVSSWSVSSFISSAQASHAKGLLPYGNMKVGAWSTFGSAAGDAQVEQLGNAIAALGYPVRVVFHHEPGNSTPAGQGDAGSGFEWRDMGIRQYPRLKALAPLAIVGHVDNGFKWSPNTNGQGWTDSELNQIYTDALLAVVDTVGADYYDGATSRTNGEAAYLKVQRAEAWAQSRGIAHMDIGEWNFVKPADCDSMTSTLTANPARWWLANMFDSDNNNRANIPTIGACWGLDHGYDTSTDRLLAARRHFDHALVYP